MKFLFSPLLLVLPALMGCGHKGRILEAKIMLAKNYSMRVAEDSTWLTQLPYINSVEFVSKEEAKKIYLADDNQDWAGVLETNPLPDAFFVTIRSVKLPAEGIEAVEAEIKAHMPVSDFIVADPSR